MHWRRPAGRAMHISLSSRQSHIQHRADSCCGCHTVLHVAHFPQRFIMRISGWLPTCLASPGQARQLSFLPFSRLVQVLRHDNTCQAFYSSCSHSCSCPSSSSSAAFCAAFLWALAWAWAWACTWLRSHATTMPHYRIIIVSVWFLMGGAVDLSHGYVTTFWHARVLDLPAGRIYGAWGPCNGCYLGNLRGGY